MKTHATIVIATLLFFSTLPSFGQSVKHIQINTKVLSMPLDATALKEAGLTLDSTASMSNLGIITIEKASALLAKLESAPGCTLWAAPSILTKSGQRATSQSTREFLYPTEFTTAKLSTGSNDKPVQLSPGQGISAAPVMPTAFEMRPTGFRLEIEPVISQDGGIIDMNLSPELASFAGFVNYSSPIKAAVADKDGKIQEVMLTENSVMQPVFDTVRTVTSASVPNEHVLVLGGANGGLLPSATAKPDLKQEAKLEGKPTHAVFFFIQAKVTTP